MEVKSFKVSDIGTDVYQRAISKAHVAKIVREFDARLLGLPVVSIRDNGDAFVVDGQHRLAALAQLGIDTVDCQVLRESDTKAEASLFVKVNTTKKGLTGVDKFFGLLEAKNSSAIECRDLFKKYGFTLTRNSTSRVQTRGELTLRPNSATLAVFSEYGAQLEVSLSLLVEAFPADSDGVRSAPVAQALTHMHLVGGLAFAVDAWMRDGLWNGSLRQVVIGVLRSAQLRDFINPQIPAELASKSNADRQMGASALAISQRVALKTKRHGVRLAVAGLPMIGSVNMNKSFRVA